MSTANDQAGRRSLPHEPPHYIGTADAIFFITICCRPKGTNHLCKPEVAEKIVAAARHYHALHRWALPLLLLMPDHLHMLARLGAGAGMTDVIRNWKRYLAKDAQIQWQRDFFDHRLRTDESSNDKARYILHNPVRAGLVDRADE